MPTSFSLQDPGPIPPYSLYGRNYAIEESPHAVIHPSERPADPPSKRPADEDDDEIQFISERPVKRRRMSEKQPAISMSRQPMIPLATDAAGASNTGPNLSMAATPMPSNEPRDTERRLSTGMVGLPSDIQAMELTYALRGVSMPVLETSFLTSPSASLGRRVLQNSHRNSCHQQFLQQCLIYETSVRLEHSGL